jgi:two-component system OmpR family response regulator
MHHILLAIDDASLCDSASDYLNRQGYLTSTAASDEAASRIEREGGADFLVVDAAGCEEDALRVCSAVRSVSPSVPIIVLSSRDDSEERVRGLDAGVDDYLVKPFNPRELIARIKVVSRRASFAQREPGESHPNGYRFGEWRLDVPSRTLHHADGSVQMLAGADFRLLEAFVTHAQELLPRAQLLQLLHGAAWNRYQHSIETRVSRLRRLLRDNRGAGARTLIRSVYGTGYVFEGPVEKDYLLLPPGRDSSCDVR